MSAMDYRLRITPENIEKLVNIDLSKGDEGINVDSDEAARATCELEKNKSLTSNGVESQENQVLTLIEVMAAKYAAILAQIKRALPESGLIDSQWKIHPENTTIEIIIQCKENVVDQIVKILDNIVGAGNYVSTALTTLALPEAPQTPAYNQMEQQSPQQPRNNQPFVKTNIEGDPEIHYGYGDDFQPIET